MRTSRKIWQKQTLSITRGGILTVGMLVLLFVPIMVMPANAEDYANSVGWYRVACLVSKEFWTEEQKKSLRRNVDTAANIVVNVEKGLSISPEETDSTVKENISKNEKEK